MTQKQLGELAGIAEPTIRRYETGKLNPKIETIKKIADALDVHIFDLIGIGEKLDNFQIAIDIPLGITPESRKFFQDVTSKDARGLYDDLPYQKKLEFWDLINASKNSPSYSRDALKLAEDYDKRMDDWGRKAIRELADIEISRCEDESQFRADMEEQEEPRVINLFSEPAAAGIAAPTLGTDYEHYELKPEDPPGAAYAVRIQGDSMEPYFPDGSIVFVNHDALRDGDIGVFSVDGGTVCKQYHQEGGVVYLFSLNRKRQDADVVFFPGGNRSLVCQGRVITPRRFPVPGHN